MPKPCLCECHLPGSSIMHFTACCQGPCRWCGVHFEGLAEHERTCGKHRSSPAQMVEECKKIVQLVSGVSTEAREAGLKLLKLSNPVLHAMVRQALGERKGQST